MLHIKDLHKAISLDKNYLRSEYKKYLKNGYSKCKSYNNAVYNSQANWSL